jgi:16S rRNA (uracil1498-N3)-methyltransferase
MHEVTLAGRRAQHLLLVLKVEPGDTVRLGVVGGKLGSGRVVAIEGEMVRLGGRTGA